MKRGFTIVELLIVMAIIGILASIMLVTFSNLQAKSRDTRRIEDLREIQKALGMYYVDNNRYPAAVTPVALHGADDISILLIQSGAISGISGDPVRPTYEYMYQSAGVGDYTITFCLETDSVPNRTQGCSNTVPQ